MYYYLIISIIHVIRGWVWQVKLNQLNVDFSCSNTESLKTQSKMYKYRQENKTRNHGHGWNAFHYRCVWWSVTKGYATDVASCISLGHTSSNTSVMKRISSVIMISRFIFPLVVVRWPYVLNLLRQFYGNSYTDLKMVYIQPGSNFLFLTLIILPFSIQL